MARATASAGFNHTTQGQLTILLRWQTLVLLGRRWFSQIYGPVERAHEECSPDDIAQGDRDEVVHKGRAVIKQAQNRLGAYLQSSGSSFRSILGDSHAHGDEKHVGYTMLKAAGYEGPDREKDGEDLADNVFSRESHPYGQTDQPVTQDSPQKACPQVRVS